MKISPLMITVLFLVIHPMFSQSTEEEPDSLQLTEMIMQYQNYLDSIDKTISYQTGQITLGQGEAHLVVPDGFKYINAEQAKMILTDIWNNPPSDSWGMLVPVAFSLNASDSYVVEINFEEEGYVKDKDAKKIDYTELLETMQKDVESTNEERIKQGYDSVQLIAWASPPFYDDEQKKLHWAKELKFGDSEVNTLNYNIRILGRKGYLVLNAIGNMDILPQFKADVDQILTAVNFNSGHSYSDFNPKLDKVAAYGIGGLIAGKVLAKAGILAIILKSWKLLALGAVAVLAGLRRWMSGKNKKEETNNS